MSKLFVCVRDVALLLVLPIVFCNFNTQCTVLGIMTDHKIIA